MTHSTEIRNLTFGSLFKLGFLSFLTVYIVFIAVSYLLKLAGTGLTFTNWIETDGSAFNVGFFVGSILGAVVFSALLGLISAALLKAIGFVVSLGRVTYTDMSDTVFD